jgi:hypothetical protein
MKTKDIIEAGYNSFYTLVDIIDKKINFEEVPPDRIKGVLEGRYNAFIVAAEQLNRIKDLEESIVVFKESKFKEDLKLLIDSTASVMHEIKKSLSERITVDEESNDEALKNVVLTKKVAFDFLLEIRSTKENLESQLKVDLEAAKQNKDFATRRVKRRFNEAN